MFESIELVSIEELGLHVRLKDFTKKSVLEFIDDINEIVVLRGYLLSSDLYFELEKTGACITFPDTRYDLIFPDKGNSNKLFTYCFEDLRVAGINEPIKTLVIYRNNG